MQFAVPAVGGYLMALVSIGPEGNRAWLAVGGLLLGLSGVSEVLLLRRQMPRPLHLVPPLAYIGVVAAVRAAAADSYPAFAALLLVPLLWLALRATRTQLGFGLVVASGALMLSGPLQPEGWIEGGAPALLVCPVACFTVQRLVGKIRHQAAMLDDLAQRDQLTGALTERAWTDLFDREIVRGERTRDPLSVALVNIDGLSNFNAAYGPESGDELLKRSTAAWRRELRAGDVLGRLDGDTFGIVLPSCTDDGARMVAQRLRTATSDLETCSIGVAEWRPGESRDHVMYRVRSALKSAKEQGRDRVEVASINLDVLEDVTEHDSLLVGAEVADVLRQMSEAGEDAQEEEVLEDNASEGALGGNEVVARITEEPAGGRNREETSLVAAADDDASELRRVLRDLSSAH
jgi:diguanylate cyclase (GGDEF)-like protein